SCFVNTPRSHLSDSLRAKCDALPYRTSYTGNRCYFAIIREINHKEASSICSSILPGSQIASKVPENIF
ncbi:hypothetical protein PMAYCL1PPCAC_22280, partial [Pristionchus mayeri]